MARVLIVEDDRNSRLFLTVVLLQMGYEISEADNAEDALSLFERGEMFDLLISDLRMPGINGGEFVAMVRQQYPELPTIMASAHVFSEIMMSSLPGNTITLLKPFSRDELIKAVTSVVTSVQK